MKKNWEENLTWEQIEQMEEQGVDVTELKAKFQAREEKAEANIAELNKLRFTMGKVALGNIPNNTDLSKLDQFDGKKDPKSEFIKDTIGKPPMLFGKDKWNEQAKNSEIFYTSVIQCHPDLWKKITDELSPAAILIVYSRNQKNYKNIESLKKLSKFLNDFRDMEEIDEEKYSSEMVELYSDLDNPQSTPNVKLSEEILKEAGVEIDGDYWVDTVYAYEHDKKLPNMALPSDGILPYLKVKEWEDDTNVSYACRKVPGKYYTA